jgi:putative DNA primase/helicase
MALECVRDRLRSAADLALDEEETKRLAKWALGSQSKVRLDALLGIARTLKPIADDGLGWDSTPGLLGVANGVVDLRTGELRDGRPEDKITMCAGVEYHLEARCRRWDQYLSEVLEDPDEVTPWLQRLCGYSITAEAVQHLLIFLMGTGRNGKGVFTRVMHSVLGDYATCVSAHAFAEERRNAHSTEVADLERSRFAYCEELGEGTLNAERLKDLSGGGMKRARRMRQDTIEFRQTWQLWFTTNKLPRASDNSWGFWSRVLAVDFPYQFVGEDADTHLEAKLESEAAGILAWVVRGAVDWYAAGLGESPAAVVAKTGQYREDLDPLEPIIQAGYLVRCDTDIWTPVENLYAAYQQYANDKRVMPDRLWSRDYLSRKLRDQYRAKRRMVETAEGKKQYSGYHGIRVGNAATTVGTGGAWRVGTDDITTEGAGCL